MHYWLHAMRSIGHLNSETTVLAMLMLNDWIRIYWQRVSRLRKNFPNLPLQLGQSP